MAKSSKVSNKKGTVSRIVQVSLSGIDLQRFDERIAKRGGGDSANARALIVKQLDLEDKERHERTIAEAALRNPKVRATWPQ